MNVLFLSHSGVGLGLCQRVMWEGHRSFLWIDIPQGRMVGEGMVEKPSFAGRVMEDGHLIPDNLDRVVGETKPEVVVVDGIGFPGVAEHLRSLGIRVLGGERWGDLASSEPEYALKLIRLMGIKGINGSGTPESGVEVKVEMWWNGLSSYLHSWSIVDHEMGVGDTGPDVGCAGVVVAHLDQRSRLAVATVSKMESILRKTSFRGPVRMDVIATNREVLGLGLGVGLGYDYYQPILELYRGSITDLLFHTAGGTEVKVDVFPEYALAIRLSVPPYPYMSPGTVAEVEVKGVTKEMQRHVWFSGVRESEEGLRTTGFTNLLGCVTARGTSVREARRRAYRTIENLSVPDLQFRTDVGDRARSRGVWDEWNHREVQIPGEEDLLRRWGWLSPS